MEDQDLLLWHQNIYNKYRTIFDSSQGALGGLLTSWDTQQHQLINSLSLC